MRFRQRHVHRTILLHVTDALGDWTGVDVPFDAAPVQIIDYDPQVTKETPAPNTVAVVITHEGEDEDAELGGGLSSCRFTLFVDVYGESEPVALSISSDIKDALSRQIIALLDFTTQVAGEPTDARIEFEDIVIDQLPSAASTLDRRNWRTVAGSAVLYF